MPKTLLNDSMKAKPKLNDFITLVNCAYHVVELFKLITLLRHRLFILVSFLQTLTVLHTIIDGETIVEHFFKEILQ
jgi:hypothetical protein